MKKNSNFKIGSGSRKGFVSKFQSDNPVIEFSEENNISQIKDKIFNKS